MLCVLDVENSSFALCFAQLALSSSAALRTREHVAKFLVRVFFVEVYKELETVFQDHLHFAFTSVVEAVKYVYLGELRPVFLLAIPLHLLFINYSVKCAKLSV